MKLAIYGEIARDILIDKYGNISDRVGGAGLYAALAAAKQNASVEFLTVYGAEIQSYEINMWSKMGISFKYAVRGNNLEIPKYLVTGYKNNEKKVSRPISELTQNYNFKIPDDASAVLLFPVGHNIPISMCKEAKEKGLLVLLDPKPNEKSIKAARKALQYVDILLVNEEEAMLLANTHNIGGAIEKLYSLGMRFTIIKRGVKGCFIVDNKKNITSVDAYCSKPICTLGSGDVFGGILALKFLETNNIEQSVEAASCFAAKFIESFEVDYSFGKKALERELIVRKKNTIAQQKKINVYLAAPFFSPEEIRWVNYMKEWLELSGMNVMSPMHENGIINEECDSNKRKEIFKSDIELLELADVVVGLLDYEDEGTCFEIGYAYKENLPIIGYLSNLREVNNMLKFGCNIIVHNTELLVEEIKKYGE